MTTIAEKLPVRAMSADATRRKIFDRLKTSAARQVGLNPEIAHDDHLVCLTTAMATMQGPDPVRNAMLHNIAAACIGWLESLGVVDPFREISWERFRQDELFRTGKHHFSIGSQLVDWRRKFRVLLEEVGEVAEAVDRLEATPASKQAATDLRTEILHVAAVCVGWLEAEEAI